MSLSRRFSLVRSLAPDRRPRGAGGCVAIGVALAAAWAPSSAAQSLRRSANVWGEMPIEGEPLVLGSIELLASLLVANLVVLGAIVALVWTLRSTPEPFQRIRYHRWILRLGYLVAPLVTGTVVVLAGAQRIASVPVGLLALACGLGAVSVTAAVGWVAADRF